MNTIDSFTNIITEQACIFIFNAYKAKNKCESILAPSDIVERKVITEMIKKFHDRKTVIANPNKSTSISKRGSITKIKSKTNTPVSYRTLNINASPMISPEYGNNPKFKIIIDKTLNAMLGLSPLQVEQVFNNPKINDNLTLWKIQYDSLYNIQCFCFKQNNANYIIQGRIIPIDNKGPRSKESLLFENNRINVTLETFINSRIFGSDEYNIPSSNVRTKLIQKLSDIDF